MVSCTGSQFCGFALSETKNRWVRGEEMDLAVSVCKQSGLLLP
jgi:hypothetical protein